MTFMTDAWNDGRARAALRRIFDAAVQRANPGAVIARYLPEKPKGKCVVIGAGKASAAMAAALEACWPDVDLSGVVVTRYGYAVPTRRIEIREARHPRTVRRQPDACSKPFEASEPTIL
jgi:hydroxypyruvate reductase